MRSGSRLRDDTASHYDSDDYLISPRINLSNPDLEYTLDLSMAGILNNSYNVSYYLYIYTGDELLRPDNLYTLLGHEYQYNVVSFDSFRARRFDLTAYRGQTIQVVLRHRAWDNSILKLGSAALYWGEPDEIMSTVTAVNVPLPKVGVNVDTLKESDIVFPDFANYELVPGSLTYYKSSGEIFDEIHNEVFEADGEYHLSFKVRPKAGIDPYSDGTASVNGEYASYQRRERGAGHLLPSPADDAETGDPGGQPARGSAPCGHGARRDGRVPAGGRFDGLPLQHSVGGLVSRV